MAERAEKITPQDRAPGTLPYSKTNSTKLHPTLSKYNRVSDLCKGKITNSIHKLFFMDDFHFNWHWLAEGLGGMAAALGVGCQFQHLFAG